MTTEKTITTEYIDYLKQLPFESAELIHIDLSDYSERNEGAFQKCYISSMKQLYDDANSQDLQVVEFSLLTCTVVAMHLPQSIVNKVLKNITLSELKKSSCNMVMTTIISDEYEKAEHFVETNKGTMALLNTPIRLRVQTAKDRHYGKCWDGPNSYTVIGNYGDTTDFYIVGILNVVKLF